MKNNAWFYCLAETHPVVIQLKQYPVLMEISKRSHCTRIRFSLVMNWSWSVIFWLFLHFWLILHGVGGRRDRLWKKICSEMQLKLKNIQKKTDVTELNKFRNTAQVEKYLNENWNTENMCIVQLITEIFLFSVFNSENNYRNHLTFYSPSYQS